MEKQGGTGDYWEVMLGKCLDAGMKPASSGGTGSKGGRELPYQTTVMKNGQVVLGAGSLRKHGFPVRAKFKVQNKDGAIRLVAIREDKK